MNDRHLFTAFGPEPRCLGRIWLGFLIMPVVSGVLALLLSGGSAGVALIASVSAILVTIFGGVPAFLTLKGRGPISLSQTMWVGAALGNIPFALFALMSGLFALSHVAAGTLAEHLSPLTDLVLAAFRIILLGSAVGSLSAAVFWFVAVEGSDMSD